MKTLLIKDKEHLPEAAELLRQGGLVAVPTETVYGLCADGLNAAAAERLYEVKGRPEVKPLSLMIPGADDMDRYTVEIPEAARLLAEKFWPGPLTIVLKADEKVPEIIRAGKPTVGLRCPDHPLTLLLLRLTGTPLAGPSANPSGLPSPKNAEAVLGYFDGKIDAVIDGGPCGLGRESTVMDMSTLPYRVLRQGALSEEDIDDALVGGMQITGLTGGTGSGKTTVLEYLTRRGALGLDCDAIYHRLLTENQDMLAELRERFPQAFPDGSFDRKALGAVVFADPQALADLNAITHRYVKEEVRRQLRSHARNGGKAAVIDAIALIESGLGELCTMTVGVTADPEIRAKRIMAREGIGEEYARSRIAAQKPDSYFIENCDHVLYNNGTVEELENKCRTLFGS